MTTSAIPLECRALAERDRVDVERFLRQGMPADVYLLHCLQTTRWKGFLGVLRGARLEGVALECRGALCAASLTTDEAVERLLPVLLRRGPWGSIVGPEDPCRAMARGLLGDRPARVDRSQLFMAANRRSALGPGEPRLRPAKRSDLSRLVPLVARYRVEDRLAGPDDDHTAWIRAHVKRRVRQGLIYVIERGGDLIFTAAFTFLGDAGAGLGGIYTVPEERGQGLGARSTAELCRIALARGPYATLHVAPDNRSAVRCYEKAGLREAGAVRLTFR